jgi:hypothetical protein
MSSDNVCALGHKRSVPDWAQHTIFETVAVLRAELPAALLTNIESIFCDGEHRRDSR